MNIVGVYIVGVLDIIVDDIYVRQRDKFVRDYYESFIICLNEINYDI